MTPIALLSLVGFAVILGLVIVGARQVWLWISSGYHLHEQQLRLGKSALQLASDVVSDAKVVAMRRPV